MICSEISSSIQLFKGKIKKTFLHSCVIFVFCVLFFYTLLQPYVAVVELRAASLLKLNSDDVEDFLLHIFLQTSKHGNADGMFCGRSIVEAMIEFAAAVGGFVVCVWTCELHYNKGG